MKITPILSFLIIAFLFLSCSEPTNSVGGINYGDLTGSIFLCSFEENDQPSMLGWSFLPAYLTDRVSFSNGVPIGGGLWSVCIKGSIDPQASIYIEAGVPRPTQDSSSTYILSFWGKGRGYAWLMLGQFANVG